MAGKLPKVVVIAGSYVDLAVRCNQVIMAGTKVNGSELEYGLTGPGPNEAVQAANCGCDVQLISKVGGDPFGDMVKTKLQEMQVKTDYVFTAEPRNTGTIITIVDGEGDNTSIHHAGANSALLPSEIQQSEQIISDADVCLIHGKLPLEAIKKAICCAAASGTKLILNPVRPLTNGTQKKDLPAEYFNADILIPNLYEAADITERSDANLRTAKMIGSDLVARGARNAVITMGKRGCMIVNREKAEHIPAFEIELVDQTCSGDAFAGALAAYFAVGDDIIEAVKFASAAGALACTKFGAIDSLPNKSEIIQLLQKEDTDFLM